MKQKFVEKSFLFIAKYQDCDELKSKKIKYGLESLYNLITKVVVMLILAIILGIWREYLLLILIYASARRYTYGIHAKKSIICWITTLPVYLIGCYIIRFVFLPRYLIYTLWAFGFMSFLLWAPADTPARPLIHQEIRKKQKIKACITCIIYFFCIIFFQYSLISNAIIYCLVVQSICINPVTYKLTKTPFGNYKLYYENHGLN